MAAGLVDKNANMHTIVQVTNDGNPPPLGLQSVIADQSGDRRICEQRADPTQKSQTSGSHEAAALRLHQSRNFPQHACELLAEHGEDARLLAGGQSLIPMMNLRLARPSVLIDIGRLEYGGSPLPGRACASARRCGTVNCWRMRSLHVMRRFLPRPHATSPIRPSAISAPPAAASPRPIRPANCRHCSCCRRRSDSACRRPERGRSRRPTSSAVHSPPVLSR